MSSDRDKEIERLQRLRERQINARDPHKLTRKHMATASSREKKRKKFTADQILKEMDHKWVGLIYGFLIGGILSLVIGFLVPGSTGALIALLTLVIPPVAGFAFGASLDWRDDMRKF